MSHTNPQRSASTSAELQQFLAAANGTEFAPQQIACHELASAAIDNAQFLTESQLRGLTIFLAIAHVSPDRANELLEQGHAEPRLPKS